jgi:hypothetical protein
MILVLFVRLVLERLNSHAPTSRLVDSGKVGDEAEARSVIGLPSDADGVDAGEDVVAEGGDERTATAVGYVQGEVVLREAAVGGSVHGVSFVVDLLAGHDEGFAWWRRGFVELDAFVIFIGFDGEDEGVDLVAKLDGELEERAVFLRAYFFRCVHRGGDARDGGWSDLVELHALVGVRREEMQAAAVNKIVEDLGLFVVEVVKAQVVTYRERRGCEKCDEMGCERRRDGKGDGTE